MIENIDDFDFSGPALNFDPRAVVAHAVRRGWCSAPRPPRPPRRGFARRADFARFLSQHAAPFSIYDAEKFLNRGASRVPLAAVRGLVREFIAAKQITPVDAGRRGRPALYQIAEKSHAN